MRCDFARTSDTTLRCTVCGCTREWTRTDTLPKQQCRGATPRPAARSQAAPCVHLGSELRLQDCPTCRGNVRVKVFACPLHGETTLAKPIEGLHCCDGCWDYDPQSGQ